MPDEDRMVSARDVLEKLRQLHLAATPGPWDSDRDEIWQFSPDLGPSIRCVAFLHPTELDPVERHHEPDAALIAAARNALPALLKVAEEAQSALRAYDEAHQPGADMDWTGPMVDGPLRTALARLAEVDL